MELLGRFRRAVKKLTFLLNLTKFLTSSTWKVATSIGSRTPATITGWKQRRAFSFNDRPGLRACVEVVVINDDDCHHHHDFDGEEEGYNGGSSEGSSCATSPYPLQRATSYTAGEDINKQADMFIDNFYRHLVFEKQVSLNLRYCRDTSSFHSNSADETSSSSIVSPLSSAASNIVSPT